MGVEIQWNVERWNGIVERWNSGMVEWWNSGRGQPIKRTGGEMCCLGDLSVDFKRIFNSLEAREKFLWPRPLLLTTHANFKAATPFLVCNIKNRTFSALASPLMDYKTCR